MKRLAVLLLTVCLTGCFAPAPGSSSAAPAQEESMQYRIADGAGTDSLLLAEQGEKSGIDRLSVANLPITLDGKPAQPSALADGMLVTVFFTGGMQYTYPGGFYNPTRLEAVSQGVDDRVGLVMEVLDELWNRDTALNENVEELSVFVDEALVPQPAERVAAVWRFAELHQLPPPLTLSRQELADQGYLDEENLAWETGCYLELTASKGAGTEERLAFDAQKWRGGTGAAFYSGCTAALNPDGSWTYEPGALAAA